MIRCPWMSFMFIVARVTCKTICSKTLIVVHKDMGALKNDSKPMKMVVAYIWWEITRCFAWRVQPTKCGVVQKRHLTRCEMQFQSHRCCLSTSLGCWRCFGGTTTLKTISKLDNFKKNYQYCVLTMRFKGLEVLQSWTIIFSIVVYKYHNEYRPRDNTRLMLPFIT